MKTTTDSAAKGQTSQRIPPSSPHIVPALSAPVSPPAEIVGSWETSSEREGRDPPDPGPYKSA